MPVRRDGIRTDPQSDRSRTVYRRLTIARHYWLFGTRVRQTEVNAKLLSRVRAPKWFSHRTSRSSDACVLNYCRSYAQSVTMAKLNLTLAKYVRYGKTISRLTLLSGRKFIATSRSNVPRYFACSLILKRLIGVSAVFCLGNSSRFKGRALHRVNEYRSVVTFALRCTDAAHPSFKVP